MLCLQGTSEKSIAKGLGPSPTHEQLGLGFRVLWVLLLRSSSFVFLPCARTHKSFFFLSYLLLRMSLFAGWLHLVFYITCRCENQLRALGRGDSSSSFFCFFVVFGVFLGCCVCLQARSSSSSIKSWSNNVAPWEKGFFSSHQGR